jgi:hypothetical protein
VKTDVSNGTDICNEEHYTPQEVGKILKMDPQTVVRLFRGQPGVIEFGSSETLHKRKRKFMRIPKSVLQRFHEKQRTAR